jgi:hypothetical protein
MEKCAKMPSYLDSVRLPTAPQKRLETFGQAACGGDRWRKELAIAVGETHRVIKYWCKGHTPADLDARLLRAANVMIEQQHKRISIIKALRDQLEETA